MSSRRRLTLTDQARADFEDILLHSQTTWGVRQKDAYKRLIDQALKRIARFPELGRRREDLGVDVRGYPAGRHLIVYRLESNGVTVVRLTHQRMDPDAIFGE